MIYYISEAERLQEDVLLEGLIQHCSQHINEIPAHLGNNIRPDIMMRMLPTRLADGWAVSQLVAMSCVSHMNGGLTQELFEALTLPFMVFMVHPAAAVRFLVVMDSVEFESDTRSDFRKRCGEAVVGHQKDLVAALREDGSLAELMPMLSPKLLWGIVQISWTEQALLPSGFFASASTDPPSSFDVDAANNQSFSPGTSSSTTRQRSR